MEALSNKQQIEAMRSAQDAWSRVELRRRATMVRSIAGLISDQAHVLHAGLQSPQRRDFRETLAAELLPLAEAAQWHGRNAEKILRARNIGWRHRPWWLGRVQSIVRREPVGIVLIIGTWNYPLFLTGVQMMQALVAGNAVMVKPAVGCEAITVRLQQLFLKAGFPSELIQVLDASVEAAQRIIDAGIDKAIMTGSSRSGRAVLGRLAGQLTPSTMELSGCDALFVLEDADFDRVVSALLFGLRLNGGATCVAPRRVFVPKHRKTELESKLRQRLHEVGPTTIAAGSIERIANEVNSGRATCVVPIGENDRDAKEKSTIARRLELGLPIVLTDMALDSPLAHADIFAPLLMLFAYENLDDAMHMDRACPYGLSASIFGDEANAKRLAAGLKVGSVIINDVIMPTADPRLPFGGVGESGFGVTRGPEGLLELTRPKVLSVRRGRWLPHLEPQQSRDEPLLEGILQWLHGATWTKRCRGLFRIVRAIQTDRKQKGRQEKQEDD